MVSDHTLKQMLTPSPDLMSSVGQAFHSRGFAKLTMVDLAQYCGFSRRGLYNYFSKKEDALRAFVRYNNAMAIRSGFEAGEQVSKRGGDPIDVLTAIANARYGETRRNVETSPHTVELNAVTFMLCRDIMIEFAILFQDQLAELIKSFDNDGKIWIRKGFSASMIAQTLANGWRGVNQALPPASLSDLEVRYRQMCQAVMFGVADGRSSTPEPSQ